MYTKPRYLLRGGIVDLRRSFNVYETKVPATPEVGIISRQFVSPRENYSNEFTIGPHPLLFVEADKAWSGSVDRMVPTHLYL